jgi:flagellar motor switch/type III secretory pathway protein FliN
VAVVSSEAAAAVRPALHAKDAWRQQWTGLAGAVWCDWDADGPREVKRLVFPDDGAYAPDAGPGRLAETGAAAAFDDLLAALRLSCFGADLDVSLLRPLPPESMAPGSGAVCATVALGRARIAMLLDDACVRQMAGAATAEALPRLGKVAIGKALERAPVTLTVRAGDVELGAGTLLSIGVGDVIALPLALDAPMSVALAHGTELCKGFIGRHGDRLAVEIANKSLNVSK